MGTALKIITQNYNEPCESTSRNPLLCDVPKRYAIFSWIGLANTEIANPTEMQLYIPSPISAYEWKWHQDPTTYTLSAYDAPTIDISSETKTLTIEQVESKIASSFNKVNEVLSIYTQKHGRELRVYVLINSQKYDGRLMDKLLNIEYNLHDLQIEQGRILLNFSYIPRIYKSKSDVLHPNNKPIFER
jgi:hypothetical protein